MDGKSLIIKKDNIFNRIINFFKIKFFKKAINQENLEIIKDVNTNDNSNIKSEFEQKNESLNKLLEFQRKLESEGINEENLKNLLKDFSYEEKEKLKELYTNQNENLKTEIQTYKKKILAIKA